MSDLVQQIISNGDEIVTPFGPLDSAWIASAEKLPVVIWTADGNGNVEYLNRRWEDMTGVPVDTLFGDGWHSVIHPDDLEQTIARFEHSVATGTPFRVDCRIRKTSGEYQWVRSQADPMYGRDGRIVRWFGVVLDIEQLHQSGEQFRALAQAVPVIVWSSDASGWCDWFNSRWYEHTGLTVEESIGWGWQAAHHPEDFLEVMRRWPDCLANGQSFEMEFRLRRYDGMYQWFLGRAEPFRNEAGQIVRWYGSLIDIDVQKFAVDRSKRIAETLQDVFLPKLLPQYGDLRLDACYLPAEKDALVGGDWYDAFELPDGRLFFSIGDVAGHGLEASVTVGRLRQAIFTLAWTIEDPGAILQELDRIVAFQQPGTMVTAIVGTVDPTHTTLKYAAAGHPPPLVAHSKTEFARSLPSGDAPLGIGCNIDPQVHAVDIRPDTVIALYTDGMTEFLRDVETTERKLRAAVALMVGDTSVLHPARAIAQLVFEDMPARDDAALLLMQFSTVNEALLARQTLDLQRVWRFHSSSAHTAHTSRREVMNYLAAMASDHESLFEVELIIGEIFANTVQHAPGLVEVRIDWPSERPVLTVSDTGPGLDYLNDQLPEDDLSENGRGIFLMKRLAGEVSLKSRPGYGTELRAVLPIRRSLD